MDRRPSRGKKFCIGLVGLTTLLVSPLMADGAGYAVPSSAARPLSTHISIRPSDVAITAQGNQTTVGVGLLVPQGVAVDSKGTVYISDTGHDRVVKVPAGGGAQTVVNVGATGPSSLGIGPGELAVDRFNNLYVAEPGQARVAKVSPSGVTTSIGKGLGLSSPSGVAADRAGNIYIADGSLKQVMKIPASGGKPVGVGAHLFGPAIVAVDSKGAVYILDGAARVVKVPANGGAQSIVSAGIDPSSVTVDAKDNIYISDATNNRVEKLPATGGPATAVGVGLINPRAMAVDSAGNVYITETNKNRVIKVAASRR